MTPVTLKIEPWPRKVNQFKVLSMVTISENLKVIGEERKEMLRNESLAQTDVTRMPTHIWVTGNHSKSRCPPPPQRQGGHNKNYFKTPLMIFYLLCLALKMLLISSEPGNITGTLQELTRPYSMHLPIGRVFTTQLVHATASSQLCTRISSFPTVSSTSTCIPSTPQLQADLS